MLFEMSFYNINKQTVLPCLKLIAISIDLGCGSRLRGGRVGALGAAELTPLDEFVLFEKERKWVQNLTGLQKEIKWRSIKYKT
jgi:hypothetical protein